MAGLILLLLIRVPFDYPRVNLLCVYRVGCFRLVSSLLFVDRMLMIYETPLLSTYVAVSVISLAFIQVLAVFLCLCCVDLQIFMPLKHVSAFLPSTTMQ